MAVHIAYVGLVQVDAVGNIVSKDTATINNMLATSTQVRVLYDATYAPNGVNNPTIEEYLTLEAAGGFHVKHVSQTMIVTSTV